MPPHSVPRSGRDNIQSHGQRLFEVERTRPVIPGTITDLADVNDSAGLLDGQSWGYDYASGLHVPQSRQFTFGTPGATPVRIQTTPPLDLAYNGAATILAVRLTTPGSSNTVVELFLNGSSIASLTLGSGVMSGRVDLITPGPPDLPYVRVFAGTDVLQAGVTSAGTGAAGLSGWVAV